MRELHSKHRNQAIASTNSRLCSQTKFPFNSYVGIDEFGARAASQLVTNGSARLMPDTSNYSPWASSTYRPGLDPESHNRSHDMVSSHFFYWSVSVTERSMSDRPIRVTDRQTLDDLARELEVSGNYRVLRDWLPAARSPLPS